MAKPKHVSSNWTLFLKIFFPVFWGVFFGITTLAFLFSKSSYIGGVPINSFRLLMVSFFCTGMAVMYFTMMQLKRVEVDSDFVYVSNYMKTARYPFHNIEKLEETSYLISKVVHIYFKSPGIFGKKAIFLSNQTRLQEVLKKRKELAALYQKEV